MVVVILAIIAGVAIPRMSRGASGAGEAALKQNLKSLRTAIELYRSEHNGQFPSEDDCKRQLIRYPDIDGGYNGKATATHIYGPYLYKIPRLPVGGNAGNDGIKTTGVLGNGTRGWFYDHETGSIRSNTKDTELDSNGNPYNTY